MYGTPYCTYFGEKTALILTHGKKYLRAWPDKVRQEAFCERSTASSNPQDIHPTIISSAQSATAQN